MKNILLSVVVITTLVVAGVGGTLADFSDIEVSEDNYFATGALDLVVSNAVGTEFPTDAPKFYMITDALPCCDKSVFLDLHNYGSGWQTNPYIYLHFKNLSCGWVMPKKPYAWLDEAGNKVAAPSPLPTVGTMGTGYPRPVTEPEYVAEMGGVAGELEDGTPVTVAGMGEYGENCEVSEHVGIIGIWVAGPYEHGVYPKAEDVPQADWKLVTIPADLDTNRDGAFKLDELVCHQLELGQIPACQKIWVHISMHLQDYDEEDALAAGDISTTYFDENIPAEAKWDHWPSNAYQADFMEFDMAFELLQNQVP
jgi:predicted ribosomally synthesized peptide with SipW-like signal peptide